MRTRRRVWLGGGAGVASLVGMGCGAATAPGDSMELPVDASMVDASMPDASMGDGGSGVSGADADRGSGCSSGALRCLGTQPQECVGGVWTATDRRARARRQCVQTDSAWRVHQGGPSAQDNNRKLAETREPGRTRMRPAARTRRARRVRAGGSAVQGRSPALARIRPAAARRAAMREPGRAARLAAVRRRSATRRPARAPRFRRAAHPVVPG